MAQDTPSTLARVTQMARGAYDDAAKAGLEYEDDYALLMEIGERKKLLEGEMSGRREMYARWNNLYAPETMTAGGADHWPEDPNAKAAGRVHISVNAYPVYVDVPAHLMATTPIINYVPTGSSPEERAAAGRREHLFFAWWDRNDMDSQLQELGVVRGLYGEGDWKVRWDAAEKFPKVELVDQPGNLYVGWGNSDYTRIDWTIYCYTLSPQAVAEDFGIEVAVMKDQFGALPVTYAGDHSDPLGSVAQGITQRQQSDYAKLGVEVYDYWYKVPTGKGKKPEVWNCIYVGNTRVENARHPELTQIPYIRIRNGKVPGSPWGKSEFFDVEQILREKDERLSEMGQMIHTTIDGQKWQLVGPETEVGAVPDGLTPRSNRVISPGPNARIEAIQPVNLQFQAEDYIKRLDREAAEITGLNDLLLGLAPAQVLSSSKAISALTANYVGRIGLKRKQLYAAIREAWEVSAQMWEKKDRSVRDILDGQYRIDIKEPDVTPRDELETAQMAINLVQNRLWSMERAMDATGVEDPVDEKGTVREEQTDASLNPAAVQAQVTLLALLQQLQQPLPTQQQLQNTNRQLNRPAQGGQSLNAPENQGNPPPEAQAANAPGNAGVLAQTLTQGGQSTGRVIGQTPVGGA